jgi:hypothetical protein
MSELWSTLIPLIIGSALVPVHLIATILVLRSSADRLPAVAWVAGMTTVRLVQGAIFLILLDRAYADASDEDALAITSALLLVIAVILLVNAVRKILDQPDEEAPSPQWMAMFNGTSPGRAFMLGAGLILVDPKAWVFTLGAIGAIEYADLAPASMVLTYLAFAVLAASSHAALVGMAVVAPERANALLATIARWLEANSRALLIVVSLAFGAYFLIKALGGLGVI